MSMINYASREINCKLVYYGPGLGGKTTNLEHIYGKVSPNTRGKMISLATETERTLFFDFLPVDLGMIRGFKTRFHLYTVPGQVYYNASRKLILKGVDGIVFVADSQIERMEANVESMQNLYDNMSEYGYDLTKIPFAIQYNKRDLPNAAPVRDLQASLNPGWPVEDGAQQKVTPDPTHPGENLIERVDNQWVGRAPYLEAVAIRGDGVFDTLKTVSKLVLDAELGGRMSWTLPNILTLARICLTPVLALLPFIQGYWHKVIAFLIFIAASASDVVDGYLARRRNQVSELGQLLDPIADKLLLFATLIPIFWLTRHPTILVDYRIPWWGSLPVWVALLLVGRELLITAFRFFAKRRGVVIPAMGAGKLKAVVQNVFIGATLFWFAWKDALAAHPWAGWFRNFWDKFHGAVVAVTLGGAILLTVYSLVVYLYRYRTLLKGG